MRFHEHLVSSFIPDFVEIQRKSFSALLKKGIIKELSNRNPITNATHDLELFFFPQYYQLNRPECTPTEAILKSKSYSCKLYVPAQLTNRQTNEIKLQWLLLGSLPLMTKRGHFIINGSPRVVINQLVRSPGIYYQELIDIKKKKTYYADLISFRGAWLRLEIDKKLRLWARMKKTPKISGLVFLQALGFTREQIKTGIRFSEFLENSCLKENHPDTTEQALISLYQKSHQTLSKTHSPKENSQVTPIMGQKFLFRKFMNPRTYNLGLVGRMRLNKKFGLLISDKQLTLTRHDIFCAIDYLINLKHGLTTVDDIDNLKNRRVKASGELIQNQLNTGLIRLEKTIREKMKKVKKGLTIHSLITTKPINGALREFFGSSPLSQYLDQTNPLAEITHKRRLSSLGPGGISRETAGMAIRGIHPTHYGRICPIETPEGRNAGLVNSITIHARISSDGFIKTPFYNVYQGQIQKQDSSLHDARPIYFSAEQEERVKVAPGDLKASKYNFLPINKIPIRIGKEYHRVSREDVEYIAMSPIQMISIATSLIPFLEHDDATRALMGSNMQRQSVPIISPERPIVGTGLEARVAADSGHVVQSKSGGYVSYASGKKIIILEKDSINNFSNKLKSNVSQESNFENIFGNKLHKANSDKLLTKTKVERLTLTKKLCKNTLLIFVHIFCFHFLFQKA
jgi:DNA-directed RNA polymerase subunit beta